MIISKNLCVNDVIDCRPMVDRTLMIDGRSGST